MTREGTRYGTVQRRGRGSTPLANATPQQRRILEAWRRRASLKEAAVEMGITIQTAKNHMSDMYRRTGARGAADAFYWLGIERAGIETLSMDLVPPF